MEEMFAIDLDAMDFSEAAEPVANTSTPEDSFFLIHTSGSTGEPKLTSLSHRNGVSFISYRYQGFSSVKQTIAATVSTFDAFFYETLASLCNGTPVVLLNEKQIMNAGAFSEVVCEHDDSFIFITPTKLRGYINNCPSPEFIKHISYYHIGGEPFPDRLDECLWEKNPEARLFNIYGPTETTIYVTEKPLKNDSCTGGRERAI